MMSLLIYTHTHAHVRALLCKDVALTYLNTSTPIMMAHGMMMMTETSDTPAVM